MARRSREPGLWAMFSSGGMLSALFLPATVALLWVAAPLGWVDASAFAPLALHPLARIFLFVFVTLSFFHWAHRFRYTLYDGLQLYHLDRLIAVLTYGIAVLLTVVAAYVLVTV